MQTKTIFSTIKLQENRFKMMKNEKNAKFQYILFDFLLYHEIDVNVNPFKSTICLEIKYI